MANSETSKGASALILRMEGVTQQFCMSAGSELISSNDGADQILNILREVFAPDAVDAGLQEAVRLLQFERTDQTIDVFWSS